MSTPFSEIQFNRKAVRPIECLKAGLELVKSQYWLFLGIIAVGMIIASIVPLGILLGPMMCGIYMALFKQRRGQLVEFGDLFKGFDYFKDSLIASLLHVIPAFVIIIPTYIFFYISLIAMIGASGGQPDPAVVLGFLGFWVIVFVIVVVVMILISVVFTFAYPLIVDRGLSGMDAVKLSAKAAMGNYLGLLGLMLLTSFLGLVGAVFCYVGAFLIAPITFGALATAYEQVFGLRAVEPNNPPPPPSFV
jgi:uncharacterized membrane protein